MPPALHIRSTVGRYATQSYEWTEAGVPSGYVDAKGPPGMGG
jgi:hypothetical protein